MGAILVLAALGLVMVVRSTVSTLRARRLREQRGELQDDVGALQSALLPAPPPSLGDVGISVAYRPASGPAAGGDFHSVLALSDDRVGVIVGDVSGHGRRALALTALVHYTVRAYLEAGLSPSRSLALADKSLEGKLGDDFATVVVGVFDPSAGRLSYSTAGHPVPLVAGATAHDPIDILTPAPLGIGPLTGVRETSLPVGPGDRICFFSDGLIEARESPDSPALLGRDGLARVLGESGSDEDAEALLERVEEVTGGGRDDMTACLLTPESSLAVGHTVEELYLVEGTQADSRLGEFLTSCGLTGAQISEVLDSLTFHTEHGDALLRIERNPERPQAIFFAAELTDVPALAHAI